MATLFVVLDRARVRIFANYWQSCAPALFPDDAHRPRLNAWLAAFYHALAMLDFLAILHEKPEEFSPTLCFHGETFVQAQPLLIFAPHFVGLALLTRVFADKWAIHFLYSPSSHKSFAQFMERMYDQLSGGRAHKKNDSILPLARALKSGGRVQLSTDLDVGARDTLFVPFCQKPAATSPAIVAFAQKFNVPVIGVLCIMRRHSWWALCWAWLSRSPLVRYDIYCEPLAVGQGSLAEEQTHLQIWLESKVREHPEQYWWFHRRFKTQPHKA